MSKFKEIEAKVYPGKENTIKVEDDEKYGGCHLYEVRLSKGFDQVKQDNVYIDKTIKLQFIQKDEDGTITPGLQNEQLAYIMKDRIEKMQKVYPSDLNRSMIMGLELFIDSCKDRAKERMDRDVYGQLKV